MGIEEVITKANSLSREHNGSRLIQKKYEEGSEDVKNQIFNKLKDDIYPLSKDVFGNYAVQKILDEKDNDKNQYIVKSLKSKFMDLTTHMYGCRVVQKILDVVSVETIDEIAKELSPDYTRCIEDQNGNHVIQKLIEKFNDKQREELIDVILDKVFEFSIHQYGCRVIQKIFDYCSDDERIKILKQINNPKSIIELCQDQYGNYVIQHLLETKKGENCNDIYNALKGRIFDMAIHKYASNVIEKCLNNGTKEQKDSLINEILSKNDNVHDSLITLVKDKFGNYVIQKMIEYSEPEQKEAIIQKIISSGALKKKDNFSKHVISCIDKLGYDINTRKKKPMNETSNNMNLGNNEDYMFNNNEINIHQMDNPMGNNLDGFNGMNFNDNGFQFFQNNQLNNEY